VTVIRHPRPAPVRHRHWPLCRRCSGIALDLGSARTRAWIAGRGMVLDVPTVTFPGTGAVHPIQRGTIVDTPGTARMLERLLGHRMPRIGRPLVVVTAPVLDGIAFRSAARTAVEVLRPRAVLTVPGARAVALAAGADHVRPLLVVDIGAHLTEVVLLADGAVTDARRAALDTGDLTDGTAPELITEAVTGMVTAMLRQDRTALTRTALRRRTEALQAWLGLGVLIAVLAVAPVAAVLVGNAARSHYEDTARHQNQTRYETDATLTADAPRHPEPGSDEEKKTRYPVEVRVVTREGRTRTTRAEVQPGLTAGNTVRIWITSDGRVTDAPLSPKEIRSRTMGWALLAAIGVALTGAAAHALTGLALRRRNLAHWDTAWAETAPRWTTPT
jgi:rod shape-determining protein MreB